MIQDNDECILMAYFTIPETLWRQELYLELSIYYNFNNKTLENFNKDTQTNMMVEVYK